MWIFEGVWRSLSSFFCRLVVVVSAMGPKRAKTRAGSASPLFGLPSDFKGNQLPTHEEVMRSVAHVRKSLMDGKGGAFTPSIFEVASRVAVNLKAIWDKASIPSLKNSYIVKLIQRYNERCNAIKKSLSKSSQPVDQKRNEFLSLRHGLHSLTLPHASVSTSTNADAKSL